MPTCTTMLLIDALDENVSKGTAKRKMRPKRKAWSDEARAAALEARRSGSSGSSSASAYSNPTEWLSHYGEDDPSMSWQAASVEGSQAHVLSPQERAGLARALSSSAAKAAGLGKVLKRFLIEGVLKARGGMERMNGHSGRAHGATGRAELAERKPNTGDAAALHSVAARAHYDAAQRTSGSLSEHHQQAAEYHSRRAAALSGEDQKDAYTSFGGSKGKDKRKRMTGPDHSFDGPRPDPKRDKSKCH